MTPSAPESPASTTTPPSPEEMREVLAKMADFLQLTPNPSPSHPSLDFLQDVPLTVTARLGQTVMPIGDILKLGPGAVIELDRETNQPVDLAVRGMVFARGEVVVVNDHFAIRIKELVTAKPSRASAILTGNQDDDDSIG